MRQLNLASKTILKTKLVKNGKLTINPKKIIDDLDEFNNKYSTNFSYDITSEEICEYLCKCYNQAEMFDYSNQNQESKEWFNNHFYNYVVVNDRR